MSIVDVTPQLRAIKAFNTNRLSATSLISEESCVDKERPYRLHHDEEDHNENSKEEQDEPLGVAPRTFFLSSYGFV